MTPTELKDLAEWSAEFLKLEKFNTAGNIWYLRCIGERFTVYPEDFFDKEPDRYKGFAPILMHLGKREMEKRGFHWQAIHHAMFGYEFRVTDNSGVVLSEIKDRNEYIAFWSAAHEAMKGGSDE